MLKVASQLKQNAEAMGISTVLKSAGAILKKAKKGNILE